MKLLGDSYVVVTKEFNGTYSTTHRGIIWKLSSLNLSAPIRYALSLVGTAFGLFLLTVFSGLMLIVAPLVLIALGYAPLGPLKVKRIASRSVHKNVRDEFVKTLLTAKKLELACKYVPEGNIAHTRAHEFKDKAFKLGEMAQDLAATEKISDRDQNGAYWTGLNELGQNMLTLANSGTELGNLVANNKIQSVTKDIEIIGVDDFAESVSFQTKAYRALGSGEE